MVQFHVIARIRSPFAEKFGVPRQSGVVDAVRASVVFEPAYRSADAVRGLSDFSHVWLIWQFSRTVRDTWSATVRPPRLGGNTRMGVFATRSPFRPNSIGLSSVRLDGVEQHPELGPVLHVSGADLMDGTPILDIKPYLPYTDSHPDATGGFTGAVEMARLAVRASPALLEKIPAGERAGLLGVLENDPRPRYHSDPDRIYGLTYAGRNVKFTVSGDLLTVVEVE